MACLVAALFFLRFLKRTRDRLFGGLASAFLLLALHWTALVGVEPESETRPLVYILRLLAFVVIIAAVLDKNLKKNPSLPIEPASGRELLPPARRSPPSSPMSRTPRE
jgi:hypothetical protein